MFETSPKIILFLTVCLALGLNACVQRTPEMSLAIPVHKVTLPNGMRFLIVHREGAPIFTGYIRVGVGSYDEPMGKTGIAHLLEHMAFKGTPEIGTTDYQAEAKYLAELETIAQALKTADPKQKLNLLKQFEEVRTKANEFVIKEAFSKIYNRNGGDDLNATTSQDLTSYFVSLPNSKLELWAYLESSRLKDSIFREFYAERDVVLEERRMRVDDSPFGAAYEAFLDLAFEKSPYQYPIIGFAKDVANLTATDLYQFYHEYYIPSNIVGAVVGNVDVGQTEKILQKYFGTIPSQKSKTEIKVEPEEFQAKYKVLYQDSNPFMMIGFPKPTLPHPDDYAFDLLDQVICGGLTSHFYQRLVIQEKLVNSLECDSSTPGVRAQNLYFIYASLLPGHEGQEVLKTLFDELNKITHEGINPQAIERARKNLLAGIFYGLEQNSQLASMLSFYEILAGDWKYLIEHPQKIKSLQASDLQKIISTYLKPERAIVIEVKKK